jgi:hypothetical protein
VVSPVAVTGFCTAVCDPDRSLLCEGNRWSLGRIDALPVEGSQRPLGHVGGEGELVAQVRDVGLPANRPIVRAIFDATDIMQDALVTSRYVYVDDDHPFTVVVADELYYRTIEGKAYVSDLRDEQRFRSDVTERVLAEFGARGIESPKVAAGGAEVG